MVRSRPALLLMSLALWGGIRQAWSEPPVLEGRPVRHRSRLPRADRYGDLLPAGAIARLGTVRFRNGGAITRVAWSPDGKMLASGCSIIGPISLWDAATGREIRRMEGGIVNSVIAWSPDSKILASTHHDDSEPIHLWDVATGKAVRRIHQPDLCVYSLAWSPDGKMLASGGYGGTRPGEMIRLWDVSTGKEVGRLGWLVGHRDDIESLAWSPDGKSLASGSRDKTIRLWNVAAVHKLRDRENPAWRVLSLACLWKAVMENRGRVLARQSGSVDSLAWSPDGKTLASGSYEKRVRLWDVVTGKELRRLDARGSVAWSPDGKTLAVVKYDGLTRLWNPATGKEIKTLSGEGNWSVAWSPDGKKLAAVTRSSWICLWESATGKEIGPREAHESSVSSVSWSPDGKTIASGSSDRTIRLWNPDTGKQIRVMKEDGGTVESVAWSPDGKTLASGSGERSKSSGKDNTIRLWNPATGKEVRRLARLDTPVGALAWSPDGKTLASGDGKRAILLWEAESGKAMRRLATDMFKVDRVAWSPDGTILTWVGRKVYKNEDRTEYTIRLVETPTGKEIRRLPQGQMVTSLAWCPGGRMLFSASEDNTIHLWEAATGREIRRFIGHQGGVTSIACSPDGKIVAFASLDKTIRLWEIATGKEVRSLDVDEHWVANLAWSPDGRRLASSCDTTVLIWAVRDHPDEPPVRLTSSDLKTCWSALAGNDAARAYEAIDTLTRGTRDSVPFLAKHLKPESRRDLKHVPRLIAKLDDDRFSIRQKAYNDLVQLGVFAEKALRQAMSSPLPLEQRLRVERLLSKLDGWSGEELRGLRATTVLENSASSSAWQILGSLATGAPEARLTREAKAALKRLASRGK
jgi:WD40 repeat protein